MEYHVELSVVVPTYQSASHITAFLDRMRTVLCRFEGSSELIMVDDGSDDDTSGVIWGWVQSCLLREPAGTALPGESGLPVESETRGESGLPGESETWRESGLPAGTGPRVKSTSEEESGLPGESETRRESGLPAGTGPRVKSTLRGESGLPGESEKQGEPGLPAGSALRGKPGRPQIKTAQPQNKLSQPQNIPTRPHSKAARADAQTAGMGASSARSFDLKLVRLKKNGGQQAATLCGIAAASGAVIVTIDDDLQHQPEDIPRLAQMLAEGWDLVYGVPRERYGRQFRSIGSAARNLLFLLIFGSRARGIRPTSFRAFTAELGRKAASEPEGFLYLSAEFFRRTGRITGIPVTYEHAGERHSRYPFRKLLGTFAGLLLYCPFFPKKWRGRAGGARWSIDGTKEAGIPCG